MINELKTWLLLHKDQYVICDEVETDFGSYISIEELNMDLLFDEIDLFVQSFEKQSGHVV